MPIIHRLKTLLATRAVQSMNFERFVPEVVEGPGCVDRVGALATKLGMHRPLIVTDEILVKLGVIDPVLESLRSESLDYTLYDEVLPDPTVNVVMAGVQAYQSGKCDGIIAFGGGSSIDAAKVVGAYIANPKPIKEFAGAFKVKKKTPPLIAIPTTAGTGSETTFGAVVTDETEETKFIIGDLRLMPKIAVLDPELLRSLPKGMTAATGMDAMTHAVESFIGTYSNEKSKEWSERSVKRLFKYLLRSYEDGEDIEARGEVLKASFEAGVALCMGGLTYVHSIAHSLGGKFHTPHGVANAMVLPYVLDFYGDSVHDELSHLAVSVGLGDESEGKRNLSKKFINRIREMSAKMNMPTTVKGLRKRHIKEVAARSLREAHGELFSMISSPIAFFADTGYPVPKYMSHAQCEAIVTKFIDNSVDSGNAPLSSKL